jgi:uncharacterized repeat protein (TIGR01451 family)
LRPALQHRLFRALLWALAICMASPAHAQLRALQNPSFEANDPAGPGAPNFEILPIASVTGWSSTTGEIELWDSNFNGVPAYAGNVFAEMNANTNGTLFQNICLINGEPFGWTFAHRARSGGPATQTARFQVASSTGTVIQTLATQASTTANQVWNVNTGSATYTGASGMQRVQFSTSDAGSFGNFLDAIQLSLRPFVQISAASSTGAESVPSANMATLLVTGNATSAINVVVNITGGTATRGTDYTTPGNASTFTVTISAGTYYNTPIALGISVVDDTAVESAETINYSISAGTGYTIANTATCGASVQTTGTYTITNNDGRVTLRKQWADATVGDKADVTLSRGATAIGTLAATATTAGALVTSTTPTPVVLGETVMLGETFPSTNASHYFGSAACTGAADVNLADGLTIGAAETAIVCTYTNTRVPALVVTKTSSVLSDPVNTSNPKAIPGAALRYCILVSNPGTLAGSSIAATDLLPAGITYSPGTARSGTTCAAATTIEDDDAAGADETDPYGVSFLAGTLTASATMLAPGASFAITFDAVLN